MLEDALFTDAQEVKIITPYKRLRELRGWSQEKAAEIFGVSKRTILEVELGRRDASKQLVRAMDDAYGCKGALIQYWLPKFSFSGVKKGHRGWWHRMMVGLMRMIGVIE